MSLGQAIRALRANEGITQRELAELADIDQSYLSMIESDKRKNPGLGVVAGLASALHMSLDELAAHAGHAAGPPEPDVMSDRALRLFRELPRWRQQDVIAQLELYVRLTKQTRPSSAQQPLLVSEVESVG
jgi:transcriptional regulator with XRE-family HTH domain